MTMVYAGIGALVYGIIVLCVVVIATGLLFLLAEWIGK